MRNNIPQSTAIRVPFMAYLASDHISPATGKTIAITISKNGAAFGNPAAGATNATEIANGWYYVDLGTTDAGTLGPLLIHGAVATVDNVDIANNVVKATNGGLTALPDAAAAAANGLPTVGTGSGQINPTSGKLPATIAAGDLATDSITAAALKTDAVTEIADGLLARDLGSGTNAVVLNERTVRSALRFVRNLWTLVGTTLTVKCEDDTTTAWTATVTTDGSATPITGSNPD